ncbi:(2Fe-2S)-binding protein [Clostridium carnis]
MSKDTIVCLCKNVSEKTIVEAIKNGATSVAEVKEETGAGTGPCQGARCLETIKRLIEENK